MQLLKQWSFLIADKRKVSAAVGRGGVSRRMIAINLAWMTL